MTLHHTCSEVWSTSLGFRALCNLVAPPHHLTASLSALVDSSRTGLWTCWAWSCSEPVSVVPCVECSFPSSHGSLLFCVLSPAASLLEGHFWWQLGQQPPTFMAPGTSFMEDNFSMDWGVGQEVVSKWFKCVTFIGQFISIINIASAPPQITRL